MNTFDWLTHAYHREVDRSGGPFALHYRVVLHKGSPAYYAFLAREAVKMAARAARVWLSEVLG